ncbi:hypothetical protein, variant 1 [Aphanomyces astaci]|uniref:Uncharacterized protein n=1 Tax=Aphanomyces astaci TaxID=112090 RepID=W4F9F8_APHAT|nr:hypothetical protein, variant 1 [Aphanomyces astaci]ETV64115.1 hypothetical protein, variant 1 [Aphanomyces astaci]|eukprot:XP_009846400.1 hypothetical protein, variant 1 [Aphanomyces astaci]
MKASIYYLPCAAMFARPNTSYANLNLTVGDIVAILRWANVSANRGIAKASLELRMVEQLLHGGPPELQSRFELASFPAVVPTSWESWLHDHLAWQRFRSPELPTQDEHTTESNAPDASPTLLEATPSFWAFDHRAIRLRPHAAIGKIKKICAASRMQGTFLDRLPLVKAAAQAFAIESCAKAIFWVVWESIKSSVPDTQMLLDWYRPGDKAYELARCVESDCQTLGFTASMSNLLAHNVPFPITMNRILRCVDHTEFLVKKRTSHARTTARKKAKLFKVVHVNGHKPEMSFVRIQRPNEQYFVSGDLFDITAYLIKDNFDRPRDGKKLLQSLASLSFKELKQQTRLLVAEVQVGRPDWINPPSWKPEALLWRDPSLMTTTEMLIVCHAALEQIFCPRFCGEVRIENGQVSFVE